MSTGAVTGATEGKRNDALARRHYGAWVLAWSSVATAAEPPLGAQGAKLLLTRAGFAPGEGDVAGYARLTHAAAAARFATVLGTGGNRRRNAYCSGASSR